MAKTLKKLIIKLTTFNIINLGLLLIVTSCIKDNKLSEPENHPPKAFNLLTVQDSADNVDTKPTFSWEPASDPDGDNVTYSFYMDVDNENPTTKYASGLKGTSYPPEETIHLQRAYYWKVVANNYIFRDKIEYHTSVGMRQFIETNTKQTIR